ncbi:DNA cytosine methyltransferase [Xanthomonas translucens]|uniref:DNA cytosine methyltransferase n=2 Tax=Xanthomonas campestris pv. translucens TaxID=343 RepID=UPI00056EFED5|nr:DNA cytosine methyltransferase [Xanthomonas translucens]UKE43168.1 DNA cytosine methyltransferase [Xanthomonas translucens pv. secalis]MBC3972623.1 DNA cytosine methyltransferase [Xanthomonas translucens pv. undulosa]MCT8316400.1 DNA cytosine methyltransferase [Xanthomonas translucens pv. undulosa]QSQ55880.1 DNA cytosine methyltransferase [Xanthomonas translucens pv. undulosa]UKE39463.1 DNA cytosine methyltransferase [Xanthomonas translucens pv. undulosa]
MMSRKFKVIDLFAGAGGLGIGAYQAGAEVVASVELDSVACDTLRANAYIHGQVLEGDVSVLSGKDVLKMARLSKSDVLVVVGGPPCQPFSKAAYWTDDGSEAAYRRARANGLLAERPIAKKVAKKDARRDLVKEYWRIVRESDADGFVFENVPSIKHPRNKAVYDALVRSAKKQGYFITELTVKAVEYGVAQARERVVILGSKASRPIAPPITHSADSTLGLLPLVTAGEALEPFSGSEFFEPEEVVEGRWAQHLHEVPPGWNYKAHTSWAGHPNPTFVTETRFWNFLLKLSPNRPSWTIAANPGPWIGPFHWTSRRLRTVELATLQGFPLDYFIAGKRRDRVKQMGNAVPVPVAKAMVASVLETFGKNQ